MAPSLAISQIDQPPPVPSAAGWQERLERELAEARMHEEHRQELAALQAGHTAVSSPLQVDLSKIAEWQNAPLSENGVSGQSIEALVAPDQDLLTGYGAAITAGLQARGLEMPDPLRQGVRPRGADGTTSSLTPVSSPYEIKRGSVIPATLISGINSDLPGPITAQVGQNVFDSATGHHLLIPQGSKLIGNYQSDVGFGQRRVFVVWSDIVFPDGATLALGQLSGVDVGGRAGFSDRVDNRYLQTFGAAALVALIGTGIDLASPMAQPTALADPWYAGRSNLAQSMGELAQQTISRNLDVSPTLEIRSGYRFNVFVEHDISFSAPYLSAREGTSRR